MIEELVHWGNWMSLSLEGDSMGPVRYVTCCGKRSIDLDKDRIKVIENTEPLGRVTCPQCKNHPGYAFARRQERLIFSATVTMFSLGYRCGYNEGKEKGEEFDGKEERDEEMSRMQWLG